MAPAPVRILLIQPWVIRADNVRASLVAEGFAPRILRVDFQAALEAAFYRGGFDIVLFDPTTPHLTRAAIESLMRETGVRVPLLEITSLDDLGDRVRVALAALRN